MKILYLLITLCTTLVVYASLVCAQYNYIGQYTEAECKLGFDEYSSNSTYRGYSCSGDQSCNTNLTYRSQSGYRTLSEIADLLGVDPDTVSQTNPQYRTGVVRWDKLVYVPITCSCLTGGRMSNLWRVTYTLNNSISSYYEISNNTFQGLTTCQVLKDANQNYGDNESTSAGESIYVPLRCACPTTSQKKNGVKSLTTYVVGNGDTISSISTSLNVTSKSIVEVNDGLNKENDTVYPFTTLLIPVMNYDNSTSYPFRALLVPVMNYSNFTSEPPPPPYDGYSTSEPPPPPYDGYSTSESPPSSPSHSLTTGAIGGIAAAACAVLLAFAGVTYKFKICGSVCTYKTTINHYNKETKENDKNCPRA